MFEEWHRGFPTTDGALAKAIRDAVAGYSDVYEHTVRVGRDESSTEGGKLVRSAKFARSKLTPIFDKLDAAVAAAEQKASNIQKQVAQAYSADFKNYNETLRHGEIRAFFRALGSGDRLKVLEEARQADDQDTLRAIASVQRFLSGVPPEIHDHTRQHLIQIHAPEEAATLAALNEQRQYAAGFRTEVLQSTADLIDLNRADEIMIAARQDAEV
jgi:hypothetical protein